MTYKTKHFGTKSLQVLTLVFCLLGLIALESCKNDCDDDFSEQKYKFGAFTLDIWSKRGPLSIGDAIWVHTSLPNSLYDSVSSTNIQIEDITVFFPISRNSDQEFKTPLIEEFDEYFDVQISKGEAIDNYNFRMTKTDDQFELDITYTLKKPLNYYLSAYFNKISVSEDMSYECLWGNTDTWDASFLVLSNSSICNTFFDTPTDEYFCFTVD